MTSFSQPIHYRPLQKFLHWFVVLGVITQIAIHEPMVRVYEALSTGVTADTVDTYFAWMHVGVGSLVLLAVLLRLFLRYRYLLILKPLLWLSPWIRLSPLSPGRQVVK